MSESIWVPASQGRQYLAIAYPALVYRIEEYEKYRQREVRGEMQTLGRMYLQQAGDLPGNAAAVESRLPSSREAYVVEEFLPGRETHVVEEFLPGGEAHVVEEFLPGGEAILGEKLSYGKESEMSAQDSTLHRGREVENIWVKEGRILDLQYFVQESTVSEEKQQIDQMRMREENAQLKLAQEQIDRKLKEVETQLQKVETTAKAREDVRAFAEQVKSQLYEELHVEKLRRGLI